MNKIEYTQDEINSLLCYTGKESSNENTGRKFSLKQFLGLTGTHDDLNSFLRFVNRNNFTLEDVQQVLNNNGRVNEIREAMQEIENLYSFAYKYGLTHRLPQQLRRGDPYAARMERDRNPDTDVWTSDQFLSCSTGDVSQFATDSNGDIYQIFFDLSKLNKAVIPFINVNDALSEIGANGGVFDDEHETLLMPNMEIQFDGSHCEVPAAGVRYDVFKNYYYATIIGERAQDEAEVECTNKDLEQLLVNLEEFQKASLSSEPEDKGRAEELKKPIDEGRKKVRDFIRGRFRAIGEDIYDKTYTMDEKVQMEFERMESDESVARFSPSLRRMIAEDNVLKKRLNVGKRKYYRESFPTISHQERLEKELGIIEAEAKLYPGDIQYLYANQEDLEILAHARVEDRESRLGIKVDEMTLGDYVNAEASKDSEFQQNIAQKMDKIQKRFVREHRIRRIVPSKQKSADANETGNEAKKPNKTSDDVIYGQ